METRKGVAFNIGNKIKDNSFKIYLFVLMVMRYFVSGFKYFMYTDDNNQYGVYFRRAVEGNIFNDIILHYNRIFERPLAFLADTYLFSWFYPNMHFLLVIIVLLHFLLIIVLDKLFRKLDIELSPVVWIIIGLVPFGYEAAYWISASSRIIVSMFLAILSAALYFEAFDIFFLKSKRKITAVFAFIINLASMLFYEQTAIFSCTLFVLCAIIKYRTKIKDVIISSIIPVVNLLFTGLYYIYFMATSERATSYSRSEIMIGNIGKTVGDLFNLLINNVIRFNLRATINGLSMEKDSFIYLFVVVITILLIALFILFRNKNIAEIKREDNTEQKNNGLIKIIVGVLLIIAPLTIFFILANAYYEPRMVFPSVVGIGILADGILDLIIRRYNYIIKRCVAIAVALAFFFGGAYITKVYEDTYNIDNIIANSFIEAYRKKAGPLDYTAENKIQYAIENTNNNIYLLNTKYNYTEYDTPPLANITISDWVFLGKINSFQYNKQNIAGTELEYYDDVNNTNYYFSGINMVRDATAIDTSQFKGDELFFGINQMTDDSPPYIVGLTYDHDANVFLSEGGTEFGSIRDGKFIMNGGN